MLPLESFQTHACPAQFPVDQVRLGDQTTLCITVTNPQGCPMDLSQADKAKPCYVNPPLQSSSSMSSSQASSQSAQSSEQSSSDSSSLSSSSGAPQGAPLPTGWRALYRVKEMYWTQWKIEKRLRVEDAAQGLFSFTFTAKDYEQGFRRCAGVYLAEVVLKDDHNVTRLSEFRYLQVAPTLEYMNEGAITIPEIRMALLDFGCSNTLLDDVEFTDTEIMFAIRRPIDRWNETTPNLILYSPATFPWREHWMIGTVGYLLRMAAHKYRRNNLTYQASGMSVADQDKFNQYEAIAKDRIAEYDEWMRNKKIEINVANAYGTLSSGYGRYWFNAYR